MVETARSVTPRSLAEHAAGSADYLKAPVPSDVLARLPEDFARLVNVPDKPREQLEGAGVVDVAESLAEAWTLAREAGALRLFEDKVVFPVVMGGAGGEVSLREGDPARSHGKPWFVCYVFLPTRREPHPSLALLDWAWLGHGRLEGFLSELADLALKESWDFAGADDGHPYEILRSFITTTFYRLQSQGKVRVSADGSFAAFNTGLVDRHYDDIFACFEPNPRGPQPWVWVGFAGAGNRRLTKRVNGCFMPRPERATYVDRLEDLLFHPDRELFPDYEHILLEHPERLPLGFVSDELRVDEEATELVDRIAAAADEDRPALYRDLCEVLEDEPRLFNRLKSRVDAAIDIAKKRVSWNFKTAIPCYYPKADAMSLLLPLCLTDDDHADAALVVQLLESGNYQGQTVLTMEMAYKNARLTCRPDSDWLTPNR